MRAVICMMECKTVYRTDKGNKQFYINRLYNQYCNPEDSWKPKSVAIVQHAHHLQTAAVNTDVS